MTDADLIRKLGGAKAVAELLGYDTGRGASGHQRVCNWLKRGIPWQVKAQRAALFALALDAIERAKPARKPKAPRQGRAA